MILRLVRTGLRADSIPILIAAAVSVLMWLSETAMRDGDTSATFATLVYGQLPFPILFAVLGVRVVSQKRDRLLTQLPVSGIAVRVSGWLCYFTVIGIACLITAVMLMLFPIDIKPEPVTAFERVYPAMGWTLIASVTALMIAWFTVLIALARISHTAGSMQWPMRLVVLASYVIAFAFLFAHWVVFANGGGPFRIDGVVQWDWLGAAAFGAALVLVLADILFDRLAGEHLR